MNDTPKFRPGDLVHSIPGYPANVTLPVASCDLHGCTLESGERYAPEALTHAAEQEIGWAYPSSNTAEELKRGKTGTWYVGIRRHNRAISCLTAFDSWDEAFAFTQTQPFPLGRWSTPRPESPAHYVNQLTEMGVTRPLSRAIRCF
jgi:hypothetical protein